jgi:hypothetical protein
MGETEMRIYQNMANHTAINLSVSFHRKTSVPAHFFCVFYAKIQTNFDRARQAQACKAIGLRHSGLLPLKSACRLPPGPAAV